VIRVLTTSHASELENAIRSSPSIEFGGRVELASEFAGDVLLVDAESLPESDWHSLAELAIPVLLLAPAADAGLAASAMRAGICGVILSDAPPAEIEAAVQAIHAGLVVIAPQFVQEPEPPTAEMPDPLSERELEVLDLVAEGLSNKLIAHRLNISEHTVKTHVASIFGKLGASTRTEAVSQAIRRGLVML